MSDSGIKVSSGGKQLPGLLDGGGFNQMVKGRYGYVVCNRNDTYIGRSIRLYGEYAEQEAALFKQVCTPGDVVADVGANIGTHTMVMAQAVGDGGRVYAFEPQRVVFQTLCANMAVNSLTNVECVHAAVGAKSGFIRIPDIRYDMQSNFGGVNLDQFHEGFKTSLVALDDFLEVKRLKMIKIDVEGMEGDVLTGAARLIERLRPVLYMENDRQEKSPALLQQVFAMGYRVYWHLPPLFSASNFAGNSENVFAGVASINIFCMPREAKANLTGFTEVATPDAIPPGFKWAR